MKEFKLTYKMNLLNGEELEYSPFSRKSLKDLSVAATIMTGDDLYRAISNFIASCIVSDHDINKLPYWDAAMLFIKARSVSVSELIELKYTCKNIHNDNVCGNTILTAAILNQAFYTNSTGLIGEINISGDLTLKMRYPNIFEYLKITYESGIIGFDNDSVIANFIISIYDADDYDSIEINENFAEDCIKLVQSLPPKLYKKIMDWFKGLPNIGVDINLHCNKCSNKTTDHMRGIVDFFV